MITFKNRWRVDLIILLWVSIIYGILMTAIDIFEWRLYETITGILATPLIIISQIVFLFLIFLSVLYMVFETKNDGWGAILPFLVNMIVFGVIMYVPFRPIRVSIEARVFEAKKNDFENVILLVESGELMPDQSGTAVLPEQFKDLSYGQTISINTSHGVISVFFYSSVGVLDNFSGYMYRSNDTPPPGELIGDWYLIERIKPFWYYCVSA